MLPALILLLSFCQLHTTANSRALAENEILSYSDNFLLPTEQLDQFMQKLSYKLGTADKDWKAKERLGLDKKLMHLKKRVFEEYLPYINDVDNDQPRKERRTNGARDQRGDNFMRFGRSQHDDYMRFGRSANDDYMRFGRSAQGDFMRFGRGPGNDVWHLESDARKTDNNENMNEVQKIYLRYSRPENFMRFGRTNPTENDLSQDFMRFGRSVMANGKNTSQ